MTPARAAAKKTKYVIKFMYLQRNLICIIELLKGTVSWFIWAHKNFVRIATLTLQDFFLECTEPDEGPLFKFSAISLGQSAPADKFSQTHVVTQPERLILVRWMSLETQWKTSWKRHVLGNDFKPVCKMFLYLQIHSKTNAWRWKTIFNHRVAIQFRACLFTANDWNETVSKYQNESVMTSAT